MDHRFHKRISDEEEAHNDMHGNRNRQNANHSDHDRHLSEWNASLVEDESSNAIHSINISENLLNRELYQADLGVARMKADEEMSVVSSTSDVLHYSKLGSNMRHKNDHNDEIIAEVNLEMDDRKIPSQLTSNYSSENNSETSMQLPKFDEALGPAPRSGFSRVQGSPRLSGFNRGQTSKLLPRYEDAQVSNERKVSTQRVEYNEFQSSAQLLTYDEANYATRLQEQIAKAIENKNHVNAENFLYALKLANREAHLYGVSCEREEIRPSINSNFSVCSKKCSEEVWKDIDKKSIGIEMLMAVQEQEFIRLQTLSDQKKENSSRVLAEQLALSEIRQLSRYNNIQQ